MWFSRAPCPGGYESASYYIFALKDEHSHLRALADLLETRKDPEPALLSIRQSKPTDDGPNGETSHGYLQWAFMRTLECGWCLLCDYKLFLRADVYEAGAVRSWLQALPSALYDLGWTGDTCVDVYLFDSLHTMAHNCTTTWGELAGKLPRSFPKSYFAESVAASNSDADSYKHLPTTPLPPHLRGNLADLEPDDQRG